MICSPGEYYETAIERCRSCSIPCKISRNLCHDIGCAGYQTTTTGKPTSARRLNRNCNEVGTGPTKEQYMVIGAAAGTPMIIFIVIVLIVIRISTGRKKVICADKESQKNGRSSRKISDTSASRCATNYTVVSIKATGGGTNKTEMFDNCGKKTDGDVESTGINDTPNNEITCSSTRFSVQAEEELALSARVFERRH